MKFRHKELRFHCAQSMLQGQFLVCKAAELPPQRRYCARVFSASARILTEILHNCHVWPISRTDYLLGGANPGGGGPPAGNPGGGKPPNPGGGPRKLVNTKCLKLQRNILTSSATKSAWSSWESSTKSRWSTHTSRSLTKISHCVKSSDQCINIQLVQQEPLSQLAEQLQHQLQAPWEDLRERLRQVVRTGLLEVGIRQTGR
jgi:hypothetical protein